LGDDVVIFDRGLADEYLRVMRLLGVEINLTKSIVSPNEPIFEFAKRTYNRGVDVSPLPFKQLLGHNLSDRIGHYIAYATRGLLTSSALLKRVLTRFGSLKLSQRELGNPILSILGVLASNKLIPHRWLVESLIAPSDTFDLDQAPLEVPLMSSIKLILELNPVLGKIMTEDLGRKEESFSEGASNITYPFSSEEIRKEIYED